MTRLYWWIAIGLTLAVVLGSAVVYPNLPDQVPMHWNIHGEVDGYGSKLSATILMPLVMAGMIALFAIFPWMSPRRFEIEPFRETYLYLMVLITAMMAYLHAVALATALEAPFPMPRMLVGGLLIFFALMGNVLGRVQRNFYVGVRTPWTLASERVWADTHRLAAWMFFGIGLVGAIAIFAGAPLWVGFVLIMLAAVIPVIYSFVHYKQLERRGEA